MYCSNLKIRPVLWYYPDWWPSFLFPTKQEVSFLEVHMSAKWKVVMYLMCVALAVSLGTGCKHKQPALDLNPEGTGASTIPAGGPEGTGQPTIDLSDVVFNPATGVKTVYFDYDSSSLRADALSTLSQNAEVIKQAPGVLIQIAGHCDERGTQEYNQALGERRALAVRDHLITLGIPASQLVTISGGEEFPAVMGSTEAAYAQNRRAEFNRAQ